MDLLQAVSARHSVHKYTDQKIEGEAFTQLRQIIKTCNEESGLHIQLCLDEPDAFASLLATSGQFRNVRNYLALVGKEAPGLEEACG